MSYTYEPDKPEEKVLPPIQIDPGQISVEALDGVIDNFIVREGTDYGAVEISYEAKRDRIRKQIDRGQVIITFDPNTESVSLLTKLEWQSRL